MWCSLSYIKLLASLFLWNTVAGSTDMAWPSMDHCHGPLLALAWSTIIGANKFMDIWGSTAAKPRRRSTVTQAPLLTHRSREARQRRASMLVYYKCRTICGRVYAHSTYKCIARGGIQSTCCHGQPETFATGSKGSTKRERGGQSPTLNLIKWVKVKFAKRNNERWRPMTLCIRSFHHPMHEEPYFYDVPIVHEGITIYSHIAIVLYST